MLKGHVFQNQIFGNQVFAVFANTFLNGQNGVSKNYKNEMNVTYNENSVTVDTGVVCIQGRFLEEDSSTTITDFGSDYVYCKLVIEIDLDKENTELEFNQANYRIIKNPNDYPELTQTNIVENNSGIYQYELARFRTSANGIVDFQDMRTYLDCETIYGQIEELNTKVKNNEANINTNKNNIDKKAQTSHASSGTAYGVGTTSDYGHCKVANNLTNSSFANGVALAAYQGYLLLQEIKKKLNSSGGTITGSVLPGTDNAYDLGYPSKRFNTIYAKEFNGTNFYATNLDATTAWISNKLEVDGDIVCSSGNIVCQMGNLDIQGGDNEGNIFVNQGSIKSACIYNNETVSNSPNMYITSNGWFRRTTNTSSERHKTDITSEISDELNPEKLYDLKVKQFKYKEEYQPNKDDMRYNKNLIGFIAEDVAKIFPIASDYEKDENGKIRIENWNERYLIPPMLLLDQKHHKEIEELKVKDKEKDIIIQDLISRISRLEKLVGAENE